jgi:hypothetical protein
VATQPASNEPLAFIDKPIFVDFNMPVSLDSVAGAISIFPGIYNPNEASSSLPKLKLTAMCAGRWRVRNPNAVAMSFEWDVYQTIQRGLGVIPANTDVFFRLIQGKRLLDCLAKSDRR